MVAESKEDLLDKYQICKTGLETRGLKANINKTKILHCMGSIERTGNSGNYPCGVCRTGVGSNSMFCRSCGKWIHRRCSGVRGRLKVASNYVCPKCAAPSEPEKQDSKEVLFEDGTRLEIVDKFCYLGDMIGAAGGAEDASRTRVRCGWKKFNELAPVLTLRGASHKLKGKIYNSCVRSAMVYGSETWPMKKEDLNRLERAEHTMMRRTCGVTLRERVSSKGLYNRLGIDSISSTVTRSRLRWYGHVQRKDDMDWVKRCTEYEVTGNVGRGRSRKTWKECVENDLKRLNLDPSVAADRESWRRLVRVCV